MAYVLRFDGIGMWAKLANPIRYSGSDWKFRMIVAVPNGTRVFGDGNTADQFLNINTGVSTSFDFIRYRTDGVDTDFKPSPKQMSPGDTSLHEIWVVKSNGNLTLQLNGGDTVIEQAPANADFTLEAFARTNEISSTFDLALFEFYESAESQNPNLRLDANASQGSGIVLFDTVGSNDVTLQNAPNDDSQWVYYEPSEAPTANAGPPLTYDAGDSATLDGSVSSDDTGIVSYQWEQLTGPTVTIEDAGQPIAKYTAPELAQQEELTFQITVTDEDGQSDSAVITHTISPVEDSGNYDMSQQFALIFDGNRIGYGPGFGKLLDRNKIRVEQDNVYIADGSTGYLWGQAGGPDSGKREVGLYVDGADVRLILGGQIRSLGARATLFPDGIDAESIVTEIDLVNATCTLTADGVELYNDAVPKGTGWLSGMGFRVGGRSSNATDNGDSTYILSGNSHIGNTRVFVDDVLERDYRASGQNDVWQDVESGQDMVVQSGTGDETQWLEIGNEAAKTIALTTPVDYQFKQRVNDQGTFDIEGTYTGQLDLIQYSIDGGASWSDTDIEFADGVFTGQLTFDTGQYDLQLRFKNDDTVVTAPVKIGVGAVIAGVGHSNITGKGSRPQTFTPNGDVEAFRYLNANYFSILRDPWDSSVGQPTGDPSYDNSPGGSWVPNFATRWVNDNPDLPVCFVASSLSGSGLDDWEKGSALYQRAIDRAAVFGGYEIIICGQGSVSSKDGSTYTEFYNQFNQFINDLYADTGAAIYTMPMQNYTDGRASGDGVTGVDAIRQAIQDVCFDNDNVKPWLSLYNIDLTTSDGVHFMSDAQLTDQSNRIYEAVTQYGDTQSRINHQGVSDGVYNLTISNSANTIIYNEPVVIKNGRAATATLPVSVGESLTGVLSDGVDTWEVSGTAGDSLTGGNTPPIADAGSNQTVNSGATVTMAATLDDADGDLVTGQWSVISSPAGVTVDLVDINNPNMQWTAPNMANQGVIVLGWTANDGTSSGITDTVEITVLASAVRLLNIDIKNSAVNDQYTLKIINRTDGRATNFPVSLVDGKAQVNVSGKFTAGASVRGVLMSNSFSRGILVSGVIE